MLNVNPQLKKVFENKPLLPFRKNKNLKQLIGGNTIEKIKSCYQLTNLPTKNVHHVFQIEEHFVVNR